MHDGIYHLLYLCYTYGRLSKVMRQNGEIRPRRFQQYLWADVAAMLETKSSRDRKGKRRESNNRQVETANKEVGAKTRPGADAEHSVVMYHVFTERN